MYGVQREENRKSTAKPQPKTIPQKSKSNEDEINIEVDEISEMSTEIIMLSI